MSKVAKPHLFISIPGLWRRPAFDGEMRGWVKQINDSYRSAFKGQSSTDLRIDCAIDPLATFATGGVMRACVEKGQAARGTFSGPRSRGTVWGLPQSLGQQGLFVHRLR